MDNENEEKPSVEVEVSGITHKLTFKELVIIVGSSLAAHPETGDYEVAFALDPDTGDLDCAVVSSDGVNGWKIFTNSGPEYDFPVVVKERVARGFTDKIKGFLKGKKNDGNRNC